MEPCFYLQKDKETEPTLATYQVMFISEDVAWGLEQKPFLPPVITVLIPG